MSETLTMQEAAKALGISINVAYDAAHRGEIPVIRIGRRMLVPRDRLYREVLGAQPKGVSE